MTTKAEQETALALTTPVVGVVMGSKSDLVVMQEATKVLDALGVMYERTVVSAHRTPERMYEYAKSARERGLKVIIAGAGGAAHLPGMVASLTTLPVVGVPVKSSNSIAGIDSLLSIVQMPGGVPVATVAVNGAKNAGILAAQIVGTSCPVTAKKLAEHKAEMEAKVLSTVGEVEKQSASGGKKGWLGSIFGKRG